MNSEGRGIVDNITPYVEGGTVTARLGWRNSLNDAVTYTPQTSENPYTGDIDFSIQAQYIRAEVTISGNWTIAHGIGVQQQLDGTA